MTSQNQVEDAIKDTPQILHSPPTIPTEPGDHAPTSSNAIDNDSEPQSRIRRRFSRSGRREAKHIRLQGLNPGTKSATTSIYYGSFNQSARRSATSLRSPVVSPPSSPRESHRVSMSHSHLESLLQDLDVDLETYGVEELRDGFFDGAFVKPPKVDHEELREGAEDTLPPSLKKTNPLSSKQFLPSQWREVKSATQTVVTTRAGIRLAKSFLAFFIAYILCLVPVIRIWLGRYSYITVLSTLLNHPGRAVGAQLDGAFLTSLGTVTGLGWGAFALWLSDSTLAAERAYGGILATFLALFMGTMAALRSYYVRGYQLVIAAGLAAIYTTLADTSESIRWGKLFDYGIPWLIGQAIALIVCLSIFPDAGARPLAVSLHSALSIMMDGLTLPRPNQTEIHRQLSMTFVNLSEAYRDLILDVSISRFPPSDIEALRNLMQAVIRSLLSLRMETVLFDDMGQPPRTASMALKVPSNSEGEAFTGNHQRTSMPPLEGGDLVINIGSIKRPSITRTNTGDKAVRLVTSKLSQPTSKLLSCMRNAFEGCDAVLMDMSGYRKYLGPPGSTSSDIVGLLTKLRKFMIKYDEAEESLLDNPSLPPTYSDHPEVVELFLFVHPIRQAATSVEALLVKVMEMQQRQLGWRIYLPSYPFKKGLQRTNAQVRHDRGGLTVGFYFRSANELAKTMRGMANIYKPLPDKLETEVKADPPKVGLSRSDTMGKYEEEEDIALNRNSQISKKRRFRYKLWLVIHRLQGFETRFALKVVIVTSLLATPGWLRQSRGWWNRNESWWTVAMAWIMAHPRVGGNFQDLITRALCGVIGAAWGGLAYAAGDGNPYVMAVFAAIYMIPMIYRFTQSSHPRSGIVGCISFVVVSLAAKSNEGQETVMEIAWTRGVAFVVGVVSAVMVSWVLWPFIARHELRKALSAMMIYSSIIYRGVVARYVYYETGNEPGREDIERSEMLEGRLREGFVRIRQLMALTRHEIRLRGPFDPLPYSALIEACERFFEYLVSVRQSSIFFHRHFISSNEEATENLLSYRRDAVAAILMNLYILGGALRGNRKVPRYLPSAALARKRLLDKMAEVEAAVAHTREIERIQSGASEGEGRRWAQIYSYSYSQSLTGCVKQLEQLVIFTKQICGELGFDPILKDAEIEGERHGS